MSDVHWHTHVLQGDGSRPLSVTVGETTLLGRDAVLLAADMAHARRAVEALERKGSACV